MQGLAKVFHIKGSTEAAIFHLHIEFWDFSPTFENRDAHHLIKSSPQHDHVKWHNCINAKKKGRASD